MDLDTLCFTFLILISKISLSNIILYLSILINSRYLKLLYKRTQNTSFNLNLFNKFCYYETCVSSIFQSLCIVKSAKDDQLLWHYDSKITNYMKSGCRMAYKLKFPVNLASIDLNKIRNNGFLLSLSCNVKKMRKFLLSARGCQREEG